MTQYGIAGSYKVFPVHCKKNTYGDVSECLLEHNEFSHQL